MKTNLQNYITASTAADATSFMNDVITIAQAAGYTPVEINTDKPWGAYVKFDGANADTFIAEFFPGLSPLEARLGDETAELSPKILVVSPGQRLSWQYHNRRAERWIFLTDGAYRKSLSDEQGAVEYATAGAEVQFACGERHRLVGLENGFAVVAEIWQHTDRQNLSNEEDIVRLEDDYSR